MPKLACPCPLYCPNAGVVQLLPLGTCAVLTFPWVAINALIAFVHDPYSAQQDAFNVDGLVTWTERVLFTSMRARFHFDARRPEMPAYHYDSSPTGRPARQPGSPAAAQQPRLPREHVRI